MGLAVDFFNQGVGSGVGQTQSVGYRLKGLRCIKWG